MRFAPQTIPTSGVGFAPRRVAHNAGWRTSTYSLIRFFASGTQGNEGDERRLHQ